MSDEKRGILEVFRPSREIKETIPAGTKYLPGKSAVQSYKAVEQELTKRVEGSASMLEKLKAKASKVEVSEKGIFIPAGSDLLETVKDMNGVLAYLQVYLDNKQSEKALQQVRELIAYEENYANKYGLEEVRRKFMESDAMTAAALQDKDTP
ncbi:MAG: hypothetical protein WC375_09950 [Methanomassiliicoccales archaeon]|jgi:hypothetical protein